MATTPPYGGPDDPAHADPGQKWTGRASVSRPAPPSEPASRPVAASRPVPPQTYPRAPVYGKKRLRPRWGRIALVSALALLLVAGVAGLGTYLWLSNVNDGLNRTDPFEQVANRPPKVAEGSLNILLLGTDSRDPDAPIDQPGKWRTDTIVLMHIPASHDKAYLFSFPRDLWVHVPASANGQYGNTMAKINAAYAWGGLPLMVQTVEEYTGVRMDHVVLIDFAGFKKVVDAVGGVDMRIERTITSVHRPYRKFTKGTMHLNGSQALDYIRQRKQFPDGDFARMRHQQQFLRALMDQAVSAGTVSNPFRLRDFVNSVADAIIVDQQFSLIDLGWQFRGLRSSDLVFFTSPHQGTGDINGESVVLSDREKALSLYQAVANDTVGAWMTQNAPSPSAPANGGG
jgi:LCP family protein required for cell wall assembly